MAGALARQLKEHIVTITTKVARKQSPIYKATVISRNPDGTLNVDDGRGGCRRVVAAANVRVGEQIIVGTEPQIGQVTSLGEVQFDIPPSTLSCPDDPRLDPTTDPGCGEELIGVSCPPPLETDELGNGGQFNNHTGDNWDNRVSDLGFFPSSNCVLGLDGFWHLVGWTGDGGGSPITGQYGAGCNATSKFLSPIDCAHSNTSYKSFDLQCLRGYFEFLNPLEPGQVVTAAALEFSVDAVSGLPGPAYRSDDDLEIVVVPSHVTFPSAGFQSAIDLLELGRYRILDVVGNEGAANYGVSIPLDAGAMAASGLLSFSTILLAIITDQDFTGTRPPMPGLAAFLAGGSGFDRRNFIVSRYPTYVTAPPRLRILTANV